MLGYFSAYEILQPPHSRQLREFKICPPPAGYSLEPGCRSHYPAYLGHPTHFALSMQLGQHVCSTNPQIHVLCREVMSNVCSTNKRINMRSAFSYVRFRVNDLLHQYSRHFLLVIIHELPHNDSLCWQWLCCEPIMTNLQEQFVYLPCRPPAVMHNV